MAKKGGLSDLLGAFTAGGKLDHRRDAEPGETVEQVSRPRKAPGILDPIMDQLLPNEKFDFLSGLMDFMGDYVINMLDQYSFELGMVENSIANMQSTVTNQVRTVRNQIDIARQQGMFKVQEQQASPFSVAGKFPMDKLAAATAAAEEPKKRREATERDVMDIAASIRTLITRQKTTRPAGTEPGMETTGSGTPMVEPGPAEVPGASQPRASIDSKLEANSASTASRAPRNPSLQHPKLDLPPQPRSRLP
jgi:hypothetical protein